MRRKTTSCVFPRRSAAFLADMLSPEGGKRLTKSATIESANSSTSLVLNRLPNMDLILLSALGALYRAQAVEQGDDVNRLEQRIQHDFRFLLASKPARSR